MLVLQERSRKYVQARMRGRLSSGRIAWARTASMRAARRGDP
jgi:hypothetical protein